jgi:hypothetical protein
MRFISKIPSPRRSRLAVPQGWSGAEDALRAIAARAQAVVLPICAVAATAILVAIGTSYLTERAHGRAAEDRASTEAASYAEHSGLLATGDAFGGYIQLLRYADDGEIRSKSTPSDVRTAALRRQLELNTNRFSALAVLTLDGGVVAATDGAMLDALSGSAYATVRANRGNANSDIILPGPGIPPYVDYATVLVDPAGEKWAVLVARGDPDRLWLSTLAASIDSGRNLIINRDGQIVAGIVGEELGSVWKGATFANDTIIARVDGVSVVCGLSAIAPNTQIDHGWNVASCLPTSAVLAGTTVTLSLVIAVILCVVLIAAFAIGTLLMLASPATARGEAAVAEIDAASVEEVIATEGVREAPTPIPPNVDARMLIEAYEARNTRLALRLRESVQARLLVASSRVEEALALQDDDPPLARVMLERAGHELDDLNEHELRAMGQELYPDLVRLGLPAALRALRKDLAGELEVDVDVEGEADSLDEDSDRAIEPALRVVMYRLALDALRQFQESAPDRCSIVLRRSGGDLWLAVRAHGDVFGIAPSLEAAALAVESYGGEFRFVTAPGSAEVIAEFGAAGSSPAAAGQLEEGAEAIAEPQGVPDDTAGEASDTNEDAEVNAA